MEKVEIKHNQIDYIKGSNFRIIKETFYKIVLHFHPIKIYHIIYKYIKFYNNYFKSILSVVG